MNKLSAIIFLIFMFLVSCQDDSVMQTTKLGPLVVEGWIDSDGHPIVRLSNSIIPNEEGGNIEDILIKWGVVKITDGTDTATLIGKMDKNYLPPYIYYTTEISGVPGKTYSVIAHYDGKTVKSSCTMPPAPQIDSIVFSSINVNDSICSASLYMRAPEDCPAYYHVSVAIGNSAKHLVPATLGSFVLETPREEVCHPIMKGKRLNDTIQFSPHWPCDTLIIVKLERVTKEIFDFWRNFEDANMFGGSQFVGSSQSLPTNIEGGYGYFSAQGVDVKVVETLKKIKE